MEETILVYKETILVYTKSHKDKQQDVLSICNHCYDKYPDDIIAHKKLGNPYPGKLFSLKL